MSNLSDFTGVPEGIISKYEEFTTSGTWTKDPAATWVYVHIVAGGAGGSYVAAYYGHGGGGGGGSVFTFRASDLGETEGITVGAGGAKGESNNPQPGGSSSFGSHITMPGGMPQGGPGAAFGSGGEQILGGRRGEGNPIAGGGNEEGGAGGYSIYGGGGGSGSGNASVGMSLFAGDGGGEDSDGQFPGGGGGGGDRSFRPGNGADGVVRIWQW